MTQETERCGEPMPDHVPLPIGTALPQAQHNASGLNGYHQLSPLPLPAGKCRTLPRWDIDTGKSRTRTAPKAAFDLEALTLRELKNMQKDVAEAISTFEDRRKAEARAKVEASARGLIYLLAELVGTETKTSPALAATQYRKPESPSLYRSVEGAIRMISFRTVFPISSRLGVSSTIWSPAKRHSVARQKNESTKRK